MNFFTKICDFFRDFLARARAPWDAVDLIKSMDEKFLAIEHMHKKNEELLSIIEQRSRTIEYVANQTRFATAYQMDFALQAYVEEHVLATQTLARPSLNASNSIRLITDHSLAYESNDYLTPESTMEGIVRPGFFVRDCIDKLGSEIKCLDLGVGGAGLVFEWAMNGVLCVGVDGSDFCAKFGIGYWPVLKNNLFHCDITKPFSFNSISDNKRIQFDVVTMWEVFEHIAETNIDSVLLNIKNHLSETGFFIGSISRLEYNDKKGQPYHLTLKSREWWREKFAGCDLVMMEEHPFNESMFCRGNGPRFQDFHNYAENPGEGFLFVARKKPTANMN